MERMVDSRTAQARRSGWRHDLAIEGFDIRLRKRGWTYGAQR